MYRHALMGLCMLAGAVFAQSKNPPKAPEFTSPEVSGERQVTLRVFAPKAESVRVQSSDIPAVGRGEMKKSDQGVWEATFGPVPAGAYRYTFNVDGLVMLDPKNTATSEANTNLFSLIVVNGSDVFDLKEVPHGAVAQVTYYSQSLKRHRRAHVYTPPGYERGEGKFPILYLLHGATDSDASWSTVGRAGVILDNLIAAKKAKPMIVVMPMGHTGPFSFGGAGGTSFDKQMAEFEKDFVEDLKPFIEKRYRVHGDRGNRAMAGLSMGGAHTLDVAFSNLKDYGYVGVFSSGVLSFGADALKKWETERVKMLDDPDAKKGLKLVWFGIGKTDFLLQTSKNTVELLKKHQFDVTCKETEGGHTWLNWRDYLAEFAPLLFRE